MPALNIVDYASITIATTSGTILSLADTGSPSSKPGAARSFVGILETAQIRARGDGTIPSTTEGVVIEVGDVIYLDESEIDAMQFIRTGATSGVIKGHYFDQPLSVVRGGK